jgi:hypothetical protein
MLNVKRHLQKLIAELPDPPLTESQLQAHAREDVAAIRAVIAKHGTFRAVESLTHPACVALSKLPHWRDAAPEMLVWFANYYGRVLSGTDESRSAKVIASLCGEPEPSSVE